jgi:hypothetical protein
MRTRDGAGWIAIHHGRLSRTMDCAGEAADLGFALANNGHDTRAPQVLSRAQEHPAHGALRRTFAGSLQGLFAIRFRCAIPSPSWWYPPGDPSS